MSPGYATRYTLLALAMLTTGIAGTATAEQPQFNASAGFPESASGNTGPGGKLFRDRCITCHGEDGKGRGPRADFVDPKPRNFQTGEFRAKFDRPRIFTAVALGKLGTAMPSWLKELSRQEIADVSEYVFQRFVIQTLETAQRQPSP